jgi:hypothetical protein
MVARLFQGAPPQGVEGQGMLGPGETLGSPSPPLAICPCPCPSGRLGQSFLHFLDSLGVNEFFIFPFPSFFIPNIATRINLYGHMARGGHELPNVSLGTAMPNLSSPCGQASPETALQPFQGWPTRRAGGSVAVFYPFGHPTQSAYVLYGTTENDTFSHL